MAHAPYVLPGALAPHPDESLQGLVVRNAERYRMRDPLRLLRRLSPPRAILAQFCEEDPSGDFGRRMATLLGLGDDAFRRLSLWHPARTSVNLLGHEVHHEMVRQRRRAVCPRCLEESCHHRAIWLVDAMPVCSRHGTWLLETCPKCSRRLRWQGIGTHRCLCGFDLRKGTVGLPGPLRLSGIAALNTAFLGGEEAPLGLTFGQSLQVAFRFGLYALGMEAQITHAQRTAGFVRTNREMMPTLLTAGWDALLDWPHGFRRLLSDVRSSSGESVAGLEKGFRGLNHWLFRWDREGWERPLSEAFAEYAATRHDVAATRHVLRAYGSARAIRRPEMTLREAQEFLGVSPVTMQRIVDRNPGLLLRTCAFRRLQPLIPIETSHLFRAKPAGHSNDPSREAALFSSG